VTDAGTLVKRLLPAWAKEPARRGARLYGTLTSSHRPFPDYLIIGTKRGGTTSLWKSLLAHPQVMAMFPPQENLKSPHYFDIHYARGPAWYRSYFPTTRSRTRHVGSADGSHQRRAVVGDASPYYMFHPLAADRVSQTLPGTRIIVVLRNPTDRAYSHYRERRKEGTEPLEFREALQAETERLAGEEQRIVSEPGYYSTAHDFCSYLARGRYLEHLEPWLSRFDASQLLILRSEDYYADPTAVLRQVFAFLGVATDARGLTDTHLNLLPGPEMDPETRSWLDDYYRPHIVALEQRLGRSFDWTA
jgi:hypothetical protein